MTLDEIFAQGKRLWLDYAEYAGALLSNGSVPWLDVSELVAWQRKAQGLLQSDVLELPVGSVSAAWLQAHPALLDAMRGKRRAVFPLKTLLADAGLRAHLLELAQGLRASFARLPLALVCPSPKRWAIDAHRVAFGADDTDANDFGPDEAEDAAAYLADFLRTFGDVGVDVLLLQESADSEPGDAGALDAYRPVQNVAAHYRWELGLAMPDGRHAGDAPGFGFVIAPQPAGDKRCGRIVPADFWSGADAPEGSANGFRYARVPGDAKPETVLQRLAALR
ncbi:MAG TPA: hypothetical protein VFM56_15415 [Solimonas sp.]|jgi:hypothetical protein|nr:hypothetical protein [Solimonas sp.]